MSILELTAAPVTALSLLAQYQASHRERVRLFREAQDGNAARRRVYNLLTHGDPEMTFRDCDARNFDGEDFDVCDHDQEFTGSEAGRKWFAEQLAIQTGIEDAQKREIELLEQLREVEVAA